MAICPEVGPEVLMGSTRMKAGTAQKLVLNMITTAAFVRMGKVYENMMVDLLATSQKLVERSRRTRHDRDGRRLRHRRGGDRARGKSVKTAIVMLKLGCDRGEAEARLAARGRLRARGARRGTREAVIARAVRLGLAALLLASVACAPTRRTIVFWQFWPTQTIQPLLDRFERERPRFRVQMERLGWQDGLARIEEAIHAGSVPDLCELGSTWMPRLLATRQLADWSAGAADLKRSLRGWELCTVGDAVYGVPWTLGTRALFFNKTLFARAGLDSTRPPETWAELYADAAGDPEARRRGAWLRCADRGARGALQEVHAVRVGQRREDPHGRPSGAIFDSPQNREALEFYLSLREVGVLDRQAALDRSFRAGTLGLELSGAWLFPSIARESPRLRYGVALVPRPDVERGTHASFAGGELLVTFQGSRQQGLGPRARRASWRSRRTRSPWRSRRGAMQPAVAEADTMPWYRQHPEQQTMIRQYETAVPAPNHPAWTELEAMIEDEVDLALHDSKSAAQAVTDANRKIAARLGSTALSERGELHGADACARLARLSRARGAPDRRAHDRHVGRRHRRGAGAVRMAWGWTRSTRSRPTARRRSKPALRREILEVAAAETLAPERIMRLDAALGERHAATVLELLAAAGRAPDQVDAIGMHGQTVRHVPRSAGQAGRSRSSSDRRRCWPSAPASPWCRTSAPATPPPAAKAHRSCRWSTGGCSARPPNHACCSTWVGWRTLRTCRAAAASRPCWRFDTGPGNALLDALMSSRPVPAAFDEGGANAARGRISSRMLAECLEDSFFRQPPPRSTGRERFGRAYADATARSAAWRAACPRRTCSPRRSRSRPPLWQRRSRASSPRAASTPSTSAAAASATRTLMRALVERLAPIPVRPLESLGVNPSGKEALAFAFLAHQTLAGLPGNVPGATGATRAVVLGHVTPGVQGAAAGGGPR